MSQCQFFQHLAFLWPSDTSVFQYWTSWMAKKQEQKESKTWHPHWQPPETRQRNTTHQISRTLTDLLSLNNGTDWMILTKHHHLHWERYITRIPNTWNQEWSQHKRASSYYFEEVIVLVALKEFVRLSFDVSMIIATNVTSSYLREIYFYV